MLAWREFPSGEAALFREPNSLGSISDINAGRNAPAKSPEAHLDALFFHSGTDLLDATVVAEVTISHSAISATSGIGGDDANQSQSFQWGGGGADHLLLDITSLGLSKEPICFVSVAGSVLSGGQPVQTDTAGRSRYVTVYSTLTEIRLAEDASRSGTSLAAADITYTVWVLREPPGPVGNELRSFDPDTGRVTLGFERFDSFCRYVQVSAGGSPFALIKGRSIDLDCGAPRFMRAGLAPFDPVPAAMALKILPGTGVFSGSLAYAGAFAGSGYLEVKAP